MNLIETEVKFYISSYKSINRRIKKINALDCGEYFEKNICYDDSDHNLAKKQILLRLRQADLVTLTLKKPIKTEKLEFKMKQEFEVIVDNFTTVRSILKILGYRKTQVYEKWRKTWIINEVKLCLDTIPFGVFLEIEGNSQKIKNTSAELGLDWDKRIVNSYLEIFETIRKKESIHSNDLTFNKLKNEHIHFEKYRRIFEKNIR